jgi:type IV fimbrial biogenesis protein FimT
MLGLTLIEATVAMSVVTTTLGVVAPGFMQAGDRRRLEAVAAQVETDIQHARSLAVARSASVRISFEAAAGASCYVVHTGSAGDCQCQADGSARCVGSAQALQVTRLDAGQPVQLSSNSRSMLFDAVKGTVTPTATVRVLGTNGQAIHQVVNIMGRVRSCSPGGQVAGYKAC